jgi:hypothetical protein
LLFSEKNLSKTISWDYSNIECQVETSRRLLTTPLQDGELLGSKKFSVYVATAMCNMADLVKVIWIFGIFAVHDVSSVYFPLIAMKRQEDITNFFVNFCQSFEFTKILDVGPGGPSSVFPLATHTVDYRAFDFSNNSNIIQIVVDFDQERLPFPDKYFDFIYSRHVLEVFLRPGDI